MESPSTSPDQPPIHPQTPLPSWVRRITTLFVITVILILFFHFFDALTTVALGVLAAAIVACALSPLLKFIPAPRGVAAGLIGLGLIAAVGFLVLTLSLPLFKPIQSRFTNTNWEESKAAIDKLLLRISNHAHFSPALSSDQLMADLGHFFATDRSWLMLAGVRDALLAVLLWVAFVFVGSIFLLSSPRDVLLSPALRAIPPLHRGNFRDMLDALGSRLRWWMIGTIGGMLVVFSASAIGYGCAGLKFALPLAMLAGLAEMVPTIGPAIAALVAILFAAAQSSGAVVGVLITYAAIQTIEAYVVLPLIMRGAVKVHPAITLFSVVFWAKVFGVPGLMLALPLNLVIGTTIEYLYVRPRERWDALKAMPESIVDPP